MRKVAIEHLLSRFESENALVHTGMHQDVLYRASTLSKPQQTTTRWISTSLAPKDGRMVYYKGDNRTEKRYIAVVYDLAQSKTQKPTDFWCYPSGYAAKLQHNTYTDGTPKKCNPPPYANMESRYDIGQRHRINDLASANARYRSRKITPLYNEVYIKAGGVSGFINTRYTPEARLRAYIASQQLVIRKVIDLPVACIRYDKTNNTVTFQGIRAYTLSDIVDDLTAISNHEWQRLLKEIPLNTPAQRALFTHIEKQLPSVYSKRLWRMRCKKATLPLSTEDWGHINAEQRKTLLIQAIVNNSPEAVRQQLSLFPEDILTVPTEQISNNTAGHLALAQRIRQNRPQRSALTAFQRKSAHERQQLRFRIFAQGRLAKWRRFTQACDQNSDAALKIALCQQALRLNKSTERKQVICTALGLPISLSTTRLKNIAQQFLAPVPSESLSHGAGLGAGAGARRNRP